MILTHILDTPVDYEGYEYDVSSSTYNKIEPIIGSVDNVEVEPYNDPKIDE